MEDFSFQFFDRKMALEEAMRAVSQGEVPSVWMELEEGRPKRQQFALPVTQHWTLTIVQAMTNFFVYATFPSVMTIGTIIPSHKSISYLMVIHSH